MSWTHHRSRAGRIALAACLLTASCQPRSISPDEVEGPFTWGGVDNVTHLRHLWFAGQPDLPALERARAEGVSVVIDLRDPAEHSWDERAQVEALGMTYHSVPVPGGRPFEAAAFERIEALVAQHHDDQVLVHCSSSNRAGAWLATHLAREHGMPVEQALAVGRRAGITRPALEEAVRGYLGAGGG